MTTSTTRRSTVLAVGALLALALSACTGSTSSSGSTTDASSSASASPEAYRVVSEATLQPGDPVPDPEGEVVLTVTGAPAASPVAFDMATLEQLGVVEYDVDDKQAEGGRVTFQGVLLRSVLDAVGAGDATVMHTTALNDYTVDIPVQDTVDYPVLLATKVDGERMSVERYGPTRVVYPTDSFDLDPTVYDPRWIWQLASIEVE